MLPQNCFPNRFRSFGPVRRRPILTTGALSCRLKPVEERDATRRRAPSPVARRRDCPGTGADAAYSRSTGKRTLRSVASASSASNRPSTRPAPIPTGITTSGFGNAGSMGGVALSRTVISENVSLLFSFASSAALSRALSCSKRKMTSRCNSPRRSRCLALRSSFLRLRLLALRARRSGPASWRYAL